MGTVKGRSRGSDFDVHLKNAPVEFDPEADNVPSLSSDAESQDEGDSEGDRVREHYTRSNTSTLRKPKDVALGPQYRGAKIGRQDVDDDDQHDPFAGGFESGSSDGDHDIDEIGDMGGSDDSSGDGDNESKVQDGEMSGFDDDESETETSRTVFSRKTVDDNTKAHLRDLMKEENSVATTLSRATKEDADKGRAVKKQKLGFDSLLNTRIKLQKSLVSTNSVYALEEDSIDAQRQEAHSAIAAAETSAFNLWASLNDLREELLAARSSQDRDRRVTFSSHTSSRKLWEHVQSHEATNLPSRNAVIQKWSAKAAQATALPKQNTLRAGQQTATIIDALQEQLTNSERLLKRAHTPRSCAPIQVEKKVNEDPRIYDDADFYGLLLKELLEQKSSDSVAASNVDVNFSLRREAKTKRNVDTKASKGRKLRYTVHEKLQNFMAPEDRKTWSERQTDELFGSLFGRRLGLGEDVEDVDVPNRDTIDGEEAGLMMFRSQA